VIIMTDQSPIDQFNDLLKLQGTPRVIKTIHSFVGQQRYPTRLFQELIKDPSDKSKTAQRLLKSLEGLNERNSKAIEKHFSVDLYLAFKNTLISLLLLSSSTKQISQWLEKLDDEWLENFDHFDQQTRSHLNPPGRTPLATPFWSFFHGHQVLLEQGLDEVRHADLSPSELYSFFDEVLKTLRFSSSNNSDQFPLIKNQLLPMVKNFVVEKMHQYDPKVLHDHHKSFVGLLMRATRSDQDILHNLIFAYPDINGLDAVESEVDWIGRNDDLGSFLNEDEKNANLILDKIKQRKTHEALNQITTPLIAQKPTSSPKKF